MAQSNSNQITIQQPNIKIALPSMKRALLTQRMKPIHECLPYQIYKKRPIYFLLKKNLQVVCSHKLRGTGFLLQQHTLFFFFLALDAYDWAQYTENM